MTISLATTSEVLRLTTSATAQIDYDVCFTDYTASSATLGGQEGAISAATTTDICAAPAASTQRLVKSLTIRNTSASDANTVTLVKFDGTANREKLKVTLSAGDSLIMHDNGFTVMDSTGRIKNAPPSDALSTMRTAYVQKTGATKEAAGFWHSDFAAAGTVGAFSIGTPGLAGRAVVGTEAGCIPLPTPLNNLYLDEFQASCTLAEGRALFDVLWVNSGIVVTTTTAQTINSVAFPARDMNGAVNGKGCLIGLLCTTTSTNPAVTNTTLSYTSSNGAGRTGAIPSVSTTCVAGTFVPFNMQAGDIDISSIQSLTLGTSYLTGAFSLALVRPKAVVGCLALNTFFKASPRERLYTDTALIPFAMATGTGASNTFMHLAFGDR